jgi:hypothetical protein
MAVRDRLSLGSTERPHPSASLLCAAALAAVLFGVVTVFSGARVLFGSDAVRQAAGDYVSWVLWFNTAAGLAYAAAGLGLWLRRAWAVRLSIALAVANVLVFAALGGHAALGGAYEMRTVAAMALRCSFWIGLAWWLWRAAQPARQGRPNHP